MTPISISDADGKEPLSICRGNREWLIQYYKIPQMIVLRYFSDDLPVQDTKRTEEQKASKHLRECPRCRAWVNSIASEPVYRRQKRLSQYCCSGMFSAVEEPERAGVLISFTMFRGEDPCWQVNGKNSFLSYCPWCGKKLPEKPFILDE